MELKVKTYSNGFKYLLMTVKQGLNEVNVVLNAHQSRKVKL